jgi:hypothetical protein
MSGRSSWSERALVALVAAAFLYSVLFRQGVPLYLFQTNEGGVWLDEAYAVLRGDVMYRDFFEFLAPGMVYFHAAVMALLGPTARAAVWGQVALGTALAVALHVLAARVAGRGWRLVPPVLVLVLAYAPQNLGSHKWPTLLCAALGLAVLTGRQGRAPLGAAAGGVLLGAGALCTQDFGAAIGVGALLARLAEPPPARRSAWWMTAGMATATGAVFCVFALQAGWRELAWDWAVFPLTRYSHHEHTGMRLLAWGPTAGAQVALCAASLAAAVATLRRARDAPERMIAASGVGALLAAVHRSFPLLHPQTLAIGCALLAVVFAAALERAWRNGSRAGQLVTAAACAAIVPGLAWGSMGLVLRRQTGPFQRERHRAGEIWLPRPMPDLAWIEARTAGDEAIFVFPLRGGVQFLTHTRNASSFPYLLPTATFHTDEQVRRAAAEIERAGPRFGVWVDSLDEPHLAPLTALIRRDYLGEALPGGLTAFRRRDVAPWVLLVDPHVSIRRED